MGLQGSKANSFFKRAQAITPYGVNSNFRYWGDNDTLIVTQGKGAYIWDVDGRKYIDYRLGFGPIILGHGHAAVVARVTQAIQGGTIFALTTPLEIQLAERISEIARVEMVRLGNTGTEVTMHALRLARAHTGREKIIKFEGQYHGMHDYLLFSTASTPISSLGSRRNPVNVPTSSGIPKGIQEYVINLPFNDFERFEEAIEAKWHDIAAVIVEPVMGNSASIMPLPGWLEKIRELCDRFGIVLIFDEVKTGFRIAPGGAQEFFGVQADIVTYAKALGNGFPIAAIGGKKNVMMTIEPGKVAHGGTYTGNVVGTSAALATLEIIENEAIHEKINQCGTRIMGGIREILTRAEIPHYVTGLPSMFSFILGTDEPPHDFRAYCMGDGNLYEELALGLIKRGVFPDADGREPWFLCAALTVSDVDETLTAFEDAVNDLK